MKFDDNGLAFSQEYLWAALTMMKADGVKTPAVDAVLGKPPRMQELSELLFRVTARSI